MDSYSADKQAEEMAKPSHGTKPISSNSLVTKLRGRLDRVLDDPKNFGTSVDHALVIERLANSIRILEG